MAGRRKPVRFSQPALSMQIKELEIELGVTLIERRKNGVQLTSEGREIARRAADILLSAWARFSWTFGGAATRGTRNTRGRILILRPKRFQ